jgi:DNA polymerase-3 subunit beta
VTIKVNSRELATAIKRAATTADTSKHPQRPILGALRLEKKGQRLEVVGADGWRLTRQTILAKGDAVAWNINVLEAKRAAAKLPKGKREVEVTLTEQPQTQTVSFAWADKVEHVAITGGTYPDYEQLIPTEFTSTVRVLASELHHAAQFVGAVAREASGIVRLQSQDNHAVVLAAYDMDGDVTRSEITADVTGEPTKIAFHERYLVSAAGVPSKKERELGAVVELSTNKPSYPGLFRLEDDPGFLQVVMPMFVQW